MGPNLLGGGLSHNEIRLILALLLNLMKANDSPKEKGVFQGFILSFYPPSLEGHFRQLQNLISFSTYMIFLFALLINEYDFIRNDNDKRFLKIVEYVSYLCPEKSKYFFTFWVSIDK